MPLDLPPPKIWLPPKPALVRAAERDVLREVHRHDRQHASFPFPTFVPAVAASGPVSAIAFRTGASSATDTLTAPSITPGELLVFVTWAMHASAPPVVLPSGFTQIALLTFSSTRRLVYAYKIAEAADSGASMTGMNGSTSESVALLVFQPTGTITTVTPASLAAQGTSGTPATQNVASSAGTPPLVVIGAMGFQSGTTSGESISPGTLIAVSGNLVVGYQTYDSSPANVSVAMGDTGGGQLLMSGYLALA